MENDELENPNYLSTFFMLNLLESHFHLAEELMDDSENSKGEDNGTK